MEINKIYQENCLDTMKSMPDNFVDLVVTSPPYNMRLRIHDNKYVKRKDDIAIKYKYFSDDLSISEFYNMHKQILIELLRVSKIVCYNFQIVSGSKEAFFKIIGDFNTNIKDIIIWDKGYGEPAQNNKILNSCYEFILVLENDLKLGRTIQNAKFEKGKLNNILRIKEKQNKLNHITASFPKKLAMELICNFSEIGDTVYDPFGGSGTTAEAAHLCKRNWIVSEISETACYYMKKRLTPILTQPVIFGL